GLVVAAAATAQVLFQIFAGAFADRGSRRSQMVAADLTAAAAQGCIVLLLIVHRASLVSLVLLELVIGTAFALHWPAFGGLVPLVAARERLQAANGLLSIAASSAVGAGAAAAGVVASRLGARYALAIDAATFLGSALLVAGVRARAQESGRGE